MRRTPLIAAALVVALALPAAPAGATYNVVLAGGPEADAIHVWLTADGREYTIESATPLEVGGDVCRHPEEAVNALVCAAPRIAGFEVNGGGGDDALTVGPLVTVPITMRGGLGNDLLLSGGGPDKLVGAAGDDRLVGGPGSDALFGGPGDDVLRGGLGNDLAVGGPGVDDVRGGPGKNTLRPS